MLIQILKTIHINTSINYQKLLDNSKYLQKMFLTNKLLKIKLMKKFKVKIFGVKILFIKFSIPLKIINLIKIY